MSQRPELRGERVVLRGPRPGDKGDRLACGRHPEFVRLLGGDEGDGGPLTPEEIDGWYEQLCRDPLRWVIEAEDRAVGEARLHEPNRRARYAIGIFDPACWGRGLGTEATRLVLRYAFDEMQLHRVELRVLTDNHRALVAYEKCGFVREGIERETLSMAGRWRSDLFMSILEQEYRAAVRSW